MSCKDWTICGLVGIIIPLTAYTAYNVTACNRSINCTKFPTMVLSINEVGERMIYDTYDSEVGPEEFPRKLKATVHVKLEEEFNADEAFPEKSFTDSSGDGL